jgi:hypothetical protein
VWTSCVCQNRVHRFSSKAYPLAIQQRRETECIFGLFVSGTDGNVKVDGQPDATSEAFVDISQFDSCTGEQLLAASGFTILPPDEFVVDQELNQATLNTTVVMDEFITGETFRVEVSLSWSGTGDITTQRGFFYSKSTGVKVVAFFKGTFREGEASGTVSGMVTDFTPEPSIFAQLAEVTNGEMTIIHEF